MAKGKSPSAKKLFDKLGEGTASGQVFTGMIKPDEGNDEVILFARPGDCGTWVNIATSQIKNIEFVQFAYCGNHKHPLVHLTMEEPQSPDAQTFAALARLHTRPQATAPAAHAALSMNALHRGIPGATPCYWDWSLNRWVCPPF